MSALAPRSIASLTPEDAILGREVLAHLDDQLTSARRLLAIILDQGAAIRARDVQGVVSLTGLMQAELQRRGVLEHQRARLLSQAGVRLGLDPGAVTLELLSGLMDDDRSQVARERSAELRGLLAEVRQEHHTNRALMHQELAFLDHLLSFADGGAATGYDSGGDRARSTSARWPPATASSTSRSRGPR